MSGSKTLLGAALHGFATKITFVWELSPVPLLSKTVFSASSGWILDRNPERPSLTTPYCNEVLIAACWYNSCQIDLAMHHKFGPPTKADGLSFGLGHQTEIQWNTACNWKTLTKQSVFYWPRPAHHELGDLESCGHSGHPASVSLSWRCLTRTCFGEFAYIHFTCKHSINACTCG